jgi:hypothetical protein
VVKRKQRKPGFQNIEAGLLFLTETEHKATPYFELKGVSYEQDNRP